uniref:Rieske 2Fe-2S domain-containing protein n=1 Tax=Janibacter limosus TaxID=53458 RepID=A0AC61U5V8_9MICO|nr:Rieske 2Fe-2S domain-containing protein [Janibacter limosus]
MTIDDRPGTDVGPILSDGTPFADLFDLDKHEVSMRLLKDPEVYRLELSRLFGKAWTVLAHETEIPNAFDYVARHIGADPVIVTRSRSGDVNVVLNICSHRGMQVCRGEAGNEKQFKCPYHGWSFSEQGKFMGSPVARGEHARGLPFQGGARTAQGTGRTVRRLRVRHPGRGRAVPRRLSRRDQVLPGPHVRPHRVGSGGARPAAALRHPGELEVPGRAARR